MRIYGGIQYGHSRGGSSDGILSSTGCWRRWSRCRSCARRRFIPGTKKPAGEFAKKYHLDAVFTDLEAFASSDAFDAAYIASPNLCHFEQAMCLLRHGKHVLLEKPGVLTRKQTETLVETANANHVVYLEAMRLVFDDALPIIRDALPGNRDTPPRHGGIYAVLLPLRPRPRRESRISTPLTPALCNAAILDMGCYPIHALISMFGEPAHVSAEAYHLESGFEAGGIALLRYDGFVCEAIWSKVCKQAAPTIHGRGRLRSCSTISTTSAASGSCVAAERRSSCHTAKSCRTT